MIGHNYPVGTKVQHRNGYIRVKVEGDEGPSWQAESRRVWELYRAPLEPGDRLFHIDGDRTNNKIGNLSMIHFNQTRFVMLRESRVLFMPTIRTINKKTGKVLLNS